MPADIECIAYVLDAEEDDGTTLHECHLQNGHRDPHECLCGERWPHVGQAPFEIVPITRSEARAALERLIGQPAPSDPLYEPRSTTDG